MIEKGIIKTIAGSEYNSTSSSDSLFTGFTAMEVR